MAYARQVRVEKLQNFRTYGSGQRNCARFVEQNLDADEDEIPDWYELHEFEHSILIICPTRMKMHLAKEERKYGLNGNIKDSIREGGISVRRSALTKVNLGGGSFVKITSDPPGMLNSEFILQRKKLHLSVCQSEWSNW